MSCDLSDPAILEAYDEIQAGRNNWMLLTYRPNSRDTLYMSATGSYGLDEMKTHLRDDVCFAYLRFPEKNVLVYYVPSTVMGVKRARALVHGRQVAGLLKNFSMTLTVSSAEEMTPASFAVTAQSNQFQTMRTYSKPNSTISNGSSGNGTVMTMNSTMIEREEAEKNAQTAIYETPHQVPSGSMAALGKNDDGPSVVPGGFPSNSNYDREPVQQLERRASHHKQHQNLPPVPMDLAPTLVDEDSTVTPSVNNIAPISPPGLRTRSTSLGHQDAFHSMRPGHGGSQDAFHSMRPGHGGNQDAFHSMRPGHGGNQSPVSQHSGDLQLNDPMAVHRAIMRDEDPEFLESLEIRLEKMRRIKEEVANMKRLQMEERAREARRLQEIATQDRRFKDDMRQHFSHELKLTGYLSHQYSGNSHWRHRLISLQDQTMTVYKAQPSTASDRQQREQSGEKDVLFKISLVGAALIAGEDACEEIGLPHSFKLVLGTRQKDGVPLEHTFFADGKQNCLMWQAALEKATS